MPRKIIFDAHARLEFEDAVVWYESQQIGLGNRFETEVHSTFERILANPERFKAVSKKIRRARVNVFKQYNVFFRVEPDFIGIVSVFHGARNPAELHGRLK